jgi:pappalysin-1
MRFSPILLGLGLSALASARCGTRPPSDNIKAHHKYFQEKEDRESARPLPRDIFDATIDTYVHVILTNSSGFNTTGLPAQITAQIDVLNENYEGTGFQFNLVNVSYTRNNNWQVVTDGTTAEYEMKSTLRKGDYTALNLYFGTIGNGILGYACVSSPPSLEPSRIHHTNIFRTVPSPTT